MIKKYWIMFVLILFTLVRVYFHCGEGFEGCINEGGYKESQAPTGIHAILGQFRSSISFKIRQILPSPHSELVLGMVIGVNDLRKNPTFNDVLITTGTIHVVVVSGYNISLVLLMVLKVTGSRYKLRSIIVAQLCAVIYAVIAGLGPPVVRALIMASIFVWGKYYGRELEALRVLIIASLIMIMVNPEYLFNLSFQLSVLATIGLVSYSGRLQKVIAKLIKGKNVIVMEDLAASLAAQVLVWPVIAYKFGRVSILGSVVNMLVLWTVPIVTILGFFLVVSVHIGTFIGMGLSRVLVYVIAPLLEYFIGVTRLFDTMYITSINYSPNRLFVVIYYILLLLIASTIGNSGTQYNDKS